MFMKEVPKLFYTFPIEKYQKMFQGRVMINTIVVLKFCPLEILNLLEFFYNILVIF